MNASSSETPASLDELDRKILRELQNDATQSLESLADRVGSSKTPVWTRIRRMRDQGVITRQVALLDPDKVGFDHCFFVLVRTSRHESGWLEDFMAAVQELPEIQEAHRLAGEIDYILKVRVRSTRHFDEFYKRLVAKVEIFNVTSLLSMETMKMSASVPL
ncbi:MAG: Lrp/AsnC family transcriptional regulator [Neomegalonema sp.]|nr:Lrp/AsnC family transcriptional regulator [Neomegalonema sp.]